MTDHLRVAALGVASPARRRLYRGWGWRGAHDTEASGGPDRRDRHVGSGLEVSRRRPVQGAQHVDHLTSGLDLAGDVGPPQAQFAGGPEHALDRIGRADNQGADSVRWPERAAVPEFEADGETAAKECVEQWRESGGGAHCRHRSGRAILLGLWPSGAPFRGHDVGIHKALLRLTPVAVGRVWTLSPVLDVRYG